MHKDIKNFTIDVAKATKKIIVVKVILNDEREFFIKETNPYSVNGGIYFTPSASNASNYKSVSEFKVAWCIISKYFSENFTEKDIKEFRCLDIQNFKSSKIKFERIDWVPLNNRTNVIVFKGRVPLKTLEFPWKEFRALMDCGINNSCYLHNENDEWMHPKNETEYNKVTNIRCLKRGFTYIFHSIFEYRNSPLPSCYKHINKQRFLFHNERIHDIVLAYKMDSCETFKLVIKQEDK